MNEDRWRRIEELYHAARLLKESSRSSFLAAATEGDEDLRHEVESLLVSGASSPGFLDQPVQAAGAAALVSDASSPSGRPIGTYSVHSEQGGYFTAGTQLGPYRVEQPLGEGGMGVVYRARDTKLNRPVAIKFLSDKLADAAGRRRFQREAQTASSLNHPHILTVHDAGEIDDRQYLVTEFVDGGTLSDWIRHEPRPWREVIELLIGVADALTTAHEAGILHRDIKPDNILITKSGYAKLADFGLAKLLESPAQRDEVTRTVTGARTRLGAIVGTVSYMSPEQASGLPLDARSDVFSFGVVLYEVLAGRRPFSAGSEAETLNAVVRGVPPPLPDHVPAPLRVIVEKALEKNPSDRYQTMRELVVDLRRLSRQIVDRPIENGKGRGWRVAAAVTLLAAAIGGWWGLRGLRPAESSRVGFTPLTNFSDSAVAPALLPDGRILAFIRGEDTFAGPGDVYVKLLPDGEPVRLTHDHSRKMGPLVFSPDGSRIAYTDTGSTWTVPVLGGEPTRMLARVTNGLSWFVNQGQRRILFSAGTGEGIHMGLFTATESRTEERSVYIPADINGMAHRSFLSPDHKSVLAVEMDIRGWLPCRLLPFDGSSPGTRVGPQPSLCTDAAWSPDGKWMYFSADTGGGYHIWRQRYPDGMPEQVTTTATEEQGISFAADGRSFVTSVGERLSTIWVHDARGEREITSQGYAFVPSFSADGKHLYYLQRARANRRFVSGELWSVVLDTGKRERLLPDFLMEHYSVAPDGNHVTFVSVDDAGHSSVWIARLDGSVAPKPLSSLESVRARFGPGNDVFFVGGETTTSMFLYRVKEDGSGLQKISPNRVLFLYDVSPDGKWASVWQLEDSAVVLYSTGSDARTIVCTRCGTAGEENRGVTPPLVSWSRDGRYMFLHMTASLETYALALPVGRMIPSLPEAGFNSIKDAAAALRAKPISDPRAFPNSDPSVYAFPRLTAHRNIYRITVPE